MRTVPVEDTGVRVPGDSERCTTLVGMTGVSPRLSYEASVRCPESAVMTVEVSCGRGHVIREQVCEPHGPATSGYSVCGQCLQDNRVCPVTVTRVS